MSIKKVQQFAKVYILPPVQVMYYFTGYSIKIESRYKDDEATAEIDFKDKIGAKEKFEQVNVKDAFSFAISVFPELQKVFDENTNGCGKNIETT